MEVVPDIRYVASYVECITNSEIERGAVRERGKNTTNVFCHAQLRISLASKISFSIGVQQLVRNEIVPMFVTGDVVVLLLLVVVVVVSRCVVRTSLFEE